MATFSTPLVSLSYSGTSFFHQPLFHYLGPIQAEDEGPTIPTAACEDEGQPRKRPTALVIPLSHNSNTFSDSGSFNFLSIFGSDSEDDRVIDLTSE